MKNLLVIFLIMLGQVVSAGTFQDFIERAEKDVDYHNTKWKPKDKALFKTGYLSVFDAAYKEKGANQEKKRFSGYLPEDLYNTHFLFVQSLFFAGYMDSKSIDLWRNEYQKLFGQVASSPDTEKQFWKSKYSETLDFLFSKIGDGYLGCANEGDKVDNRKCCKGSLRINAMDEGSIANRCIGKTKACTNNNECCSGMCNQTDVTKPGVCLAKLECSAIREVGEVCSNNNAICRDSQCLPSNKDKMVMKCSNCKRRGTKLKGNEKCCLGLLKLNNKCVRPIPVLVPTVYNKKNKLLKIFTAVINLIFPSAYAADLEITEAQKALLVEKRNSCEEDFAGDEDDSGLDDCLEAVSRLETSFTSSLYKDLTSHQEQLVSDKREQCTKDFPTPDPNATNPADPHTVCMGDADTIEETFLAANKVAGTACANSNEVGTEEYKQCMVTAGLMGEALTAENYVDRYKIPGVTAKTYSDIKKCEFNSFNDSWKDASNKEKNSEIFLRAFEYAFSHKGTQDYWEDGASGKGNIFKRANEVAKLFRINRGLMLTEMKEIDKTMSCKCIAIFGPSNFNSAKVQFFNNSCEAEKAALQVTLGEDLGKGGGDSKIDGTSVSTLEDKVTKDEAKLEEVDKAAMGISHEKLLMEWLNLRAESQMKRFVDNSDLEKDLSDLSEFITNTDFSEVFKDRVENDAFMESDPKGDSNNGVPIFKWGYTYDPSWMNWIDPIGGLIFNYHFGSNGSGGNYTANVAAGMKAAWREYDDIVAAPQLVDIKTVDGHCIKKRFRICIEEMDGFERYFLGPRFKNESTVLETQCEVNGRASACFKTGYEVPFEGDTRYIIDPTLPLFVASSVVSINVMPGYTVPYRKMINTARDAGYNFVKHKGTRLPFIRDRVGNIHDYRNGGDTFGSQDHIGEGLLLGHFLPQNGNLINQTFETGKIQIINGAKKYAQCKSLKECGAAHLEPELNGFGYLFESPTEANEFAKYAYDIHFKWSHLTENDFMGYPLAAMDEYFRLAAYNMKLVGSLASSRSMQYAEAYELYKADWEKRVTEYNSLGQIAMGTQSRNIQYSPAFYDLFQKLSLNGETNIPKFDAELFKANGTANFSTAEIKALEAGRSSALRRNKDILRKKEFDAALLSASAETKNGALAYSEKLNKINNPIASIGISKFGGKGLKNLTAAINNMNKSIKGMSGSRGSNRYNGGGASFTMPSLPSFNRSSVGSPGPAPKGNYNDQGMNKNQINALLKNLKKDRKLKPLDTDNLFTIVSKAYKRNYSKVLNRNGAAILEVKKDKKMESTITDKNKTNLKNLLESN